MVSKSGCDLNLQSASGMNANKFRSADKSWSSVPKHPLLALITFTKRNRCRDRMLEFRRIRWRRPVLYTGTIPNEKRRSGLR
jgi:hypothetical protein